MFELNIYGLVYVSIIDILIFMAGLENVYFKSHNLMRTNIKSPSMHILHTRRIICKVNEKKTCTVTVYKYMYMFL